MRGIALLLAGLTAATTVAVAAGCQHHDRRRMTFTPKEECVAVPDEPRFNNPPSAEWRNRPKNKDEKTLVGGKPGGPLNPGGF